MTAVFTCFQLLVVLGDKTLYIVFLHGHLLFMLSYEQKIYAKNQHQNDLTCSWSKETMICKQIQSVMPKLIIKSAYEHIAYIYNSKIVSELFFLK